MEWKKRNKTLGFHLWNKIWRASTKCQMSIRTPQKNYFLLPAKTHRDTLWLNFLIVLFRCWIIFWLLKTIIAKPNNTSNWISCLRAYSWFTMGCRRGRRQIRAGEKSRSNFRSMKSRGCLHSRKAWDEVCPYSPDLFSSVASENYEHALHTEPQLLPRVSQPQLRTLRWDLQERTGWGHSHSSLGGCPCSKSPQGLGKMEHADLLGSMHWPTIKYSLTCIYEKSLCFTHISITFNLKDEASSICKANNTNATRARPWKD